MQLNPKPRSPPPRPPRPPSPPHPPPRPPSPCPTTGCIGEGLQPVSALCDAGAELLHPPSRICACSKTATITSAAAEASKPAPVRAGQLQMLHHLLLQSLRLKLALCCVPLPLCSPPPPPYRLGIAQTIISSPQTSPTGEIFPGRELGNSALAVARRYVSSFPFGVCRARKHSAGAGNVPD